MQRKLSQDTPKCPLGVVTQTYPPESQRRALPDGGCSYRWHSGNTRGGRRSLRRWAAPSRKPAWCRSGRCRCPRGPEQSLYASHTERQRSRVTQPVHADVTSRCQRVRVDYGMWCVDYFLFKLVMWSSNEISAEPEYYQNTYRNIIQANNINFYYVWEIFQHLMVYDSLGFYSRVGSSQNMQNFLH